MAGLAPAEALIPLGSGMPCNAAAMSPASTPEKTAPKTEVPNEPPMERKNVAPDVPAPRSA